MYFQRTFARPNAFHPCVPKLRVAGTSTPPKPSTANTATTAFAELIGAALGTSGAHRTDNRRRGCCGQKRGGGCVSKSRWQTHWHRTVHKLLRYTNAYAYIWNLLAQARMPSTHVCSNSELPKFPHLPYQTPPRPQQLDLPDLLVPHLGHTGLAVLVALVTLVTLTIRVIISAETVRPVWRLCEWKYVNRHTGVAPFTTCSVTLMSMGIFETYLRKHECLPPMCAQTWNCWDLRTSQTKSHHDHNSWLCRIFWYHSWGI